MIDDIAGTRITEVDVQAVEVTFSQIMRTCSNKFTPRFDIRKESGDVRGAEVRTTNGQHGQHVLVCLLEVIESLEPGNVNKGELGNSNGHRGKSF